MAKEAYPLTDKKLLDSYIYTKFLYGVRNQRIQQKLIDEYGTTTNLQEVIRVAKLQEQYEEMYLRKKFENDTEVEIKIKKASIDDNSNKDQLNKPSVSFIIQIIISISNMDKDIIIQKIVEIEFQQLINTKNQQNKFKKN
jgi:hypothetical protein